MKLETTILDMFGKLWNVTAEVDGKVEYRDNPLGLERDHPYHGHESGVYIEDLTIKDIVLERNGETQKVESLAVMPDQFAQIDCDWIEEMAQDELITRWQELKDEVYE